MTFDELLRAARVSEELIMPGSWSHGIATFGGLTNAFMFVNIVNSVAHVPAIIMLKRP